MHNPEVMFAKAIAAMSFEMVEIAQEVHKVSEGIREIVEVIHENQ